MSELHPLAGDVSHPAPHRSRVGIRQLLVSLFLAPLVWAIQILCSYGFASMACFPRYVPLGEMSIAGLPVIVLIGSLAALVVAAGALWTAFSAWHRTRGEAGGGSHQALDAGEGRTRFLALCGIIITSIFSAAVIWEAIVAIFLPHCFSAAA
jgi:hypothetical protein